MSTETVSRSDPAPAPAAPGLVLAACCLGQFMVVLDVSVLNIALPVINEVMRFDQNSLQWVMIAYTLVFSGFLLLGGRLGDLYGRRRMFLVGITIFTVASLVGGLAYNAATLVLARGFQGLGAAIMAPATLTVLGTTFTDPAARAKAFGLWGAVAGAGGAGGAVGVLAGGLIVQWLSWRWILLVNVPIGILLFLMTARVVSELRRAQDSSRLDITGALSVTLGLMALVYGIVEAEAAGLGSTTVVASLTISALLLGFFVLDQAKLAGHPLVPLGIFRNRSVTAANLVRFGSGAALGATFYFLTLVLQQVVGYTPLQTGLAYLPLSLGIFVGARGIATSVARHGPRPVLVIALVLSASGLGWLSAADESSTFVAHLAGPCILIGIGMGMAMTASTTAGTAGLPWQLAGLGSGLLNTTRQIGDAVGLAVLVAISSAATSTVLADGGSITHARATGYGLAFLVAALLMVASLAAALAVPGTRRPADVPS